MRPLIGIPPSLDDARALASGTAATTTSPTPTPGAVAESGALPVYLPNPAGRGGLCCSGSTGSCYRAATTCRPTLPLPEGVELDLVPEAQQAFDTRLLETALARELPVLAICYGMQLLALVTAAEASITTCPASAPTAGPTGCRKPGGRHALGSHPGPGSRGILGDAPPSVNSLHHQGVSGSRRLARLGAGRRRLIEAVEDPKVRAFCLGVQWHPEKLEGPHRERLFAAFVTACGAAGKSFSCAEARMV